MDVAKRFAVLPFIVLSYCGPVNARFYRSGRLQYRSDPDEPPVVNGQTVVVFVDEVE